MVRVYVAGPIGDPNKIGWSQVNENLRAGVQAGVNLRRRGFNPTVPHFWGFAWPGAFTVTDWMDLARASVPGHNALLRLPGVSPGADEEVAIATAAGIPVYHSIEELVEAFRSAA